MDKKTNLHECCHTGEEVDTPCCCKKSECLTEEPTEEICDKCKSLHEELDCFELTLLDKLTFPFYRMWSCVKDKYRNIRDYFQRGRRGFGDSDLWNTDEYLCSLIVDMISRVRQDGGCPTDKEDEWDGTLQKIIDGYGMYINLEVFTYNLGKMGLSKKEFDDTYNKYIKTMKENMALLIENLEDLWI